MAPRSIFDASYDEILERQLEKLFSDADRSIAYRFFGIFVPYTRFLQPARPILSKPTRWLKWPAVTFGLLALLLVTTRILAAGTSVAHSRIEQTESETTTESKPVVQNVVLSTASPTPLDASIPTSPLPSSFPGPTLYPATLVTAPAQTRTPPLTSTPSARPNYGPTASLTPTIVAPPRPVISATTTPAPAYALGMGQIPTPAPLIPMPDHAINIVLLGSDQRPHETQWRTDVIIIVSVNPETPSVSMLTIPRDTWLYIPNWAYQRINLADTHGDQVGYPGGGPGLVKAVIEYNFGIHIDYYARVNFEGLMHIVDALEGIDVLLDCPVEDGFPDDPITEDPSVVTQISYPEPGLYHVDGKHALWLARSRYTTSEFARSRRQHRVLQAIWAKANELGFITRLPEVWEELVTAVETDLSLDDVVWLASIGLQLEPSQIYSGFIDGRYLSAWTSPGGANVLLPHTEKILKALGPLFNPYPLKAPQGFNQVEVWNGSGHSGWGLLAADKLLRNGFEITIIESIDELYEHSVILDFTTSAKGSPLPLLQYLFSANVAHVAAEEQAHAPFRLIVGADYQPCEWPAPAQWQPTPTPATSPEN